MFKRELEENEFWLTLWVSLTFILFMIISIGLISGNIDTYNYTKNNYCKYQKKGSTTTYWSKCNSEK